MSFNTRTVIMRRLILILLIVTSILFSLSEISAADTSYTITIRGTERTFIVHTPSSYDGSTAMPLLVMFHGLGNSAQFAAGDYYGWSNTADLNGLFVVFPDSRDDLNPVDGISKHWDINWSSADSQDLDFVEAIVNWMSSEYKIISTRIFTTGHSFGAFFSYYAAVHLPDIVAAFGAHSGGIIIDQWNWPTPVPTGEPKVKGYILHSTGDGVVPYSNSQNLHNALINNGHTSIFVTLASDLGHIWDKSQNQAQIDFFFMNPKQETRGDSVGEESSGGGGGCFISSLLN